MTTLSKITINPKKKKRGKETMKKENTKPIALINNIYIYEELNQRKPQEPSQELIKKLYKVLNSENITQAQITELQEIAGHYYLIYSLINNDFIIYQCKDYETYNRVKKDIERLKGLDKNETIQELQKIVKELKEIKKDYEINSNIDNTFLSTELSKLYKLYKN